MIHLNIGSNLESKFGDRYDNITLAVNLLINAKLKINRVSNFYETPSYPNKKFPSFLNVGISANYENDEIKLIKEINLIEKKIGRNRSKKNDPRVCDIDIIDFNGLVINKDDLKIPHKKCHLRNFVLYPILQIDAEWVHPKIQKNVKVLINNLDQKSRIEITRLNKNVIINT
ncbi:2-amino-4-hydroxy-6-hydroxymethyldihydropteridine diphosphokinase [Pelagibacteraceae bacterium]|jgi:2-amino-4-hydroxy-6-hydroxymethyldihydropteridine diphosphokinase|nr:2-amino-4-hydroxy-6-hydroxymethyldihydropteridine diphosphokinase [Pelagibacteraceae bacterium]MDC0529980.1 2-amino-4-hydroxy-6-hydroxymethyldihydropteridine diphosphokinase [Pelagibacteraceae bacterium]